MYRAEGSIKNCFFSPITARKKKSLQTFEKQKKKLQQAKHAGSLTARFSHYALFHPLRDLNMHRAAYEEIPSSNIYFLKA